MRFDVRGMADRPDGKTSYLRFNLHHKLVDPDSRLESCLIVVMIKHPSLNALGVLFGSVANRCEPVMERDCLLYSCFQGQSLWQ